MEAYYSYLNNFVTQNKIRFAKYPMLKWVNPYEVFENNKIRQQLLHSLGDSVLFKETKPYYKQISDGCKLCGMGLWSCLFINGKCNASCFYCPTAQMDDDIPTSQGLTFPTAESYAEYISYFKFKGVSFSGGEPLLAQDRVLSYLEMIRKKCSPDIYTWLYTNGILANETIFKKLAELDLNEVRFDIGATSYKLDKIKYARGNIKNITIEIPAIPEEKERLKKMLPEMVNAGVTNLNLHQLRLTEHNIHKLIKHNYTYIAAEKPIVLESELAALEILEYAKKQQIDIGINYCSFFFKNRFQPAGFRKQITTSIINNNQNISSRGFLREFNKNNIGYYAIHIADETKYPNLKETLELNYKKYKFNNEIIHYLPINDNWKYEQINNLLNCEPEIIPAKKDLFEIWMHEYIEKGLREY